MERLLVLLFSVTLTLATSPPMGLSDSCDYVSGICTSKPVRSDIPNACFGVFEMKCDLEEEEDKDDCTKNSGCPLPICCVNGPCCCLCIVPERPVLFRATTSPEEERVKPIEPKGFLPQQFYPSIWKPPAFSV
ncbi:MAG: hypothetical protein ACKVT2_15270 [Saprospiraceae bacterium]